MEQKIKIVLIILAVLLIGLVFLNMATFTSKQAIERDRNRLAKENSALEEKFNKISRDYRSLEDKTSSLSADLERISKEKDDLQTKYDSVDKARQELVERINSLKQEKPSTSAQEEFSAVPADAYWAKILKEKADISLQLDNLRSELKTLQINNEQLQREKSNLDLEINNLNLEKQDLKRQLEYTKKQLGYNQKVIDSISLELVGEKNDKIQIDDGMKKMKNENLILRRQLRSLNTRKIDLERKIQELQEQNTKFERNFNDMDILLKDKTIQIDTLKKQMSPAQGQDAASAGGGSSSVELPPIVVRPQQAAQAAPMAQASQGSTGKVVAINKENNFIVVDMGQDAGVKLGDHLKVYRNGNLVALLEVIQARKSISACDIKKEITPVSVGDEVR